MKQQTRMLSAFYPRDGIGRARPRGYPAGNSRRTKPIGVSEYKLFSTLPEDLRRIVPEIEDIEQLSEISINNKKFPPRL